MVVVISIFKLTWFSVVTVNKTNITYIFIWKKWISHRHLYNIARTFCSEKEQIFYLLCDAFFSNTPILKSSILSFCPIFFFFLLKMHA